MGVGLDLTRSLPAALPAGHGPVLLVVVDTEEEFDWGRPFDRRNRAVSATRGLIEFHASLSDMGVRPTYVVDHPIATTSESVDILAPFTERNGAEIGVHLHPWVTPPFEEEVSSFNSYLGNLDPKLQLAKISEMVRVVVEAFGFRPSTFKAGRYGLGLATPSLLVSQGFNVDLSSSPGFNWSGDGGPDYTRHPNVPFWFDPTRKLLELPTTGGYFGPLKALGPLVTPASNVLAGARNPTGGALRRLNLARRAMLTPEGFQLGELVALARSLLEDRVEVLTLSFHSPSAAPGHTPFVRTDAERDAFLGTIRDFVRWFRSDAGGVFLTASEVRKKLLPV
jgi:hypothetical protein